MNLYDKSSLILVPSAVKDGKVYSQRPENGDGDFTFSRSTAATRVNADGLIEKETQNLLLQSNTFDTTWSLIGASVTSGQSGYDGSNDAWLVTKSAANGYVSQLYAFNGSVTTFSVYAKAGATNWIKLFAGGNGVFFDLANGVIGSSSGTIIDSNIENVGSGWYRCSIVQNYNGLSTLRIYPADDDNDTSGTSGSIYIQDAQLEQGLVARDYIETTTTAVEGGITDNVPRLDYTDSSCPALLLEPQRTNLITHSEYLDGLLGVVNGSVSYNTTTSPEGLNNAALYTEDSSTNAHYIDSNSFTYTGGSNHIISVFAKYNGRFLTLQGTSFIIGTSYATFNLQTGEVEEESIGTASIEDYGNGWYRCSLKVTASSTSTGLATLLLNDIATGGRSRIYTGDGSSGLYYYGFQVEESSYATSYIPTYGTSVTRNADVSKVLSAADLIGQSEGTMYADFYLTELSLENRFILVISNNNQSEAIFLRHRNNNSLQVYSAGLSDNFDIRHNISTAGNYKMALGYKSGDIAFYINGTQISTDASAYGTLDMLKVFLGTQISTGFELGGEIKQSLLFKTRLSNEELATLTTL